MQLQTSNDYDILAIFSTAYISMYGHNYDTALFLLWRVYVFNGSTAMIIILSIVQACQQDGIYSSQDYIRV